MVAQAMWWDGCEGYVMGEIENTDNSAQLELGLGWAWQYASSEGSISLFFSYCQLAVDWCQENTGELYRTDYVQNIAKGLGKQVWVN